MQTDKKQEPEARPQPLSEAEAERIGGGDATAQTSQECAREGCDCNNPLFCTCDNHGHEY